MHSCTTQKFHNYSKHSLQKVGTSKTGLKKKKKKLVDKNKKMTEVKKMKKKEK